MSGSNTITSGKGKLWAAIAAAALSLVVALGFAAPMQASAAEGGAGLAAGSAQVTTQEDVTMTNPQWVELWAGCKESTSLYSFLMNTRDDAKVTSVVSSNTSVLNVKHLGSDKSIGSYSLYPLKVGKAKLTVTIVQGGATKTLNETYTVQTLPNAISSITFNGEALTVPTSKNPFTRDEFFGFKGTSATLNVKPAAGWEVTHMSGWFSKQGSSSSGIDITNGKQFTVPKGQQGTIFADLYNSASGEYFSYALELNRVMPLQLTANPTYYIGYPKVRMPQFDMIYNSSDIKILSVKSSKPSIIKAKSNSDFSKVTLQAKKPGKSKITIKYKYKDKTFTTSTMSTASKDYPVKSASVNGKSLKLKKNCYGYFAEKYKKNSATVKITAAKGWKIKSLKRYNGYNDQKGAKAKIGKSIKTPKGQTTIVTATLKKGKTTFTYSWYFDRR